MLRSSPLARRTPLRRARFMRSSRRSKYRRRERDIERMLWVKTQPCFVRVLAPSSVRTFCSGPIEADHMGERGIGQKADDSTCAPMCRGHHRERHDHAGTFRPLTKAGLRTWRGRAIAHTQAAWTAHTLLREGV